MRLINSTDALELAVAELLNKLKIGFIHETEDPKQELDFYLPGYDIYIEVKRYPSDRSNKQLQSKENIILIQGKETVDFLQKLLSKIIN